MGKRRSLHTPGVTHELTFSTYHRERVLGFAACAEAFLATLAEATQEKEWHLWAYVVMPDHVHLLLTPQDDQTIAEVLKRIKMPSSFAIWTLLEKADPAMCERLRVINDRGRPERRIWQRGGGYDRSIYGDDVKTLAINYIHNNPGKKGLVERAEDWPYSSLGYFEGLQSICLTSPWP